jgi:hypothetical protein
MIHKNEMGQFGGARVMKVLFLVHIFIQSRCFFTDVNPDIGTQTAKYTRKTCSTGWSYQKTGASLRNILLSSDVTHLTTVLAAATTADLGKPGNTLIYSSNGLVIYSSVFVPRLKIMKVPRQDRLLGLSSCILI